MLPILKNSPESVSHIVESAKHAPKPLRRAALIELAAMLARTGLRTKHILRFVGGGDNGRGLNAGNVREIWEAVNGRRPPSGQTLRDIVFRLKNRKVRQQMGCFLGFYISRGGVLKQDVDDHLAAFIAAFGDIEEITLNMGEELKIDGQISLATISAFRINYHLFSLNKCRKCGVPYLCSPELGTNCIYCGG